MTTAESRPTIDAPVSDFPATKAEVVRALISATQCEPLPTDFVAEATQAEPDLTTILLATGAIYGVLTAQHQPSIGYDLSAYIRLKQIERQTAVIDEPRSRQAQREADRKRQLAHKTLGPKAQEILTIQDIVTDYEQSFTATCRPTGRFDYDALDHIYSITQQSPAVPVLRRGLQAAVDKPEIVIPTARLLLYIIGTGIEPELEQQPA